MGNIQTNCKCIDGLVNSLRAVGYLKSDDVEMVYRAVDRGNYIASQEIRVVYDDFAWLEEPLHVSAPCVYAVVIENLSIKPGMSFLNIGSGTGYLSTIIGLMLKHNGTNHGIEVHKECIDYAHEKLEMFKYKTDVFDAFDFCEPVFSHGNIFNVVPNREYDRVYCGADCSIGHMEHIKKFVKVDGILIIPYNDNLLKLEREIDGWTSKQLLPVSFKPLIIPSEDDDTTEAQLPFWQPMSLGNLCRFMIRDDLRKIILKDDPTLKEEVPLLQHSCIWDDGRDSEYAWLPECTDDEFSSEEDKNKLKCLEKQDILDYCKEVEKASRQALSREPTQYHENPNDPTENSPGKRVRVDSEQTPSCSQQIETKTDPLPKRKRSDTNSPDSLLNQNQSVFGYRFPLVVQQTYQLFDSSSSESSDEEEKRKRKEKKKEEIRKKRERKMKMYVDPVLHSTGVNSEIDNGLEAHPRFHPRYPSLKHPVFDRRRMFQFMCDLLDREVVYGVKMNLCEFSKRMEQKINQLPIPKLIKEYLNLDRDFP